MNYAPPFYSQLQAFVALFLFVAVYLALALFTILCLVGAELISERNGLLREYGAKRVPRKTRAVSGMESEPAGSIRPRLQGHTSGNSTEMTRLLTLAVVRNQRH